MPFPSSPTVGQTYTTPGGVTFEWVASGYWKAVGGGGSATPAPSGVTFPTWTTATRPASPSAGDSGWNTDTSTVEIWDGSAWGAVGGGSGVEFPSWTTATRPASPAVGQSGLNTDLGFLEIYDGVNWDRAGNSAFFSGPTQPTNMVEGDEWLDTSVTPAVLKKYVNDLGQGLSWKETKQVSVPPTFTGTATPGPELVTFANGSAVNITFAITGGTAPYTYSVSDGTLPDGLTLSGDTLSGTPTSAGAYSFTIRATDATGAVADTDYSGSVSAPIFAGSASPSAGDLGLSTISSTNIALSTTGGASPYTYSISLGVLPAGLILSGNTISGTPTTAGPYSFTVRATDANGDVFDTVYSGNISTDISWSSVEGEYLRLDTTYPGPVITSWTASYFGETVALSADGNTLAVGEPGRSTGTGAVYVFSRLQLPGGIRSQLWFPQTIPSVYNTSTPSSQQSNAKVGQSLALSADGNTLVVGAPGESGGDGAVYTFYRSSGGVWSEPRRIVATPFESGINFGRSIALSADGKTLAVGAARDDTGFTLIGSVYMTTRTGSEWSTFQKLQASDGASLDRFGFSVSMSADGNTLAVGAYGQDQTFFSDAGAAYIFTRSGSTWTEQNILTASDAATNARFGRSVALSADGTVLAVGGYSNDGYVFTNDNGTWIEQIVEGLPSENIGDECTISADGNTLVFSGSDKCYLFKRSSSTWMRQKIIQGSDTISGDGFSQNSVSLSADGNTLAVGAKNRDSTNTDTGDRVDWVGTMYLFGV